jgi:pre-mRNA branch site protein p14
VFHDIYDAKQACDHLSGFNVQNRYLIVTYHNPIRHSKKLSLKEQEEQLKKMQDKFGVDGDQHARQAAGGGQKPT